MSERGEATERFEAAVFPFIAEIVRLGTGYDVAAVERSEDERSAVVVCENGNVYKVKTSVGIYSVGVTQEGEIEQ